MSNLTEKEAENFLEKSKFKIAKRKTIKLKSELKDVSINFPWAMKASSKTIVHKKAVGGVILNIENIKEANEAFEKLKVIKDFEEAMIQEMIKGVELIIGLKTTNEFGQVIMFGKGGSNVEKEKDVSFRALPIRSKDALEMIKEIKFYNELLKNKISIKAIKENLLKVSKLATKNKNITELDINPLIANEKQAKVVDSRIIMS